jgi:phage repressor protein C with HTH and peptisase S24 domain
MHYAFMGTPESDRLIKARKHAGFETAAAAAEALDVKEPTYMGHENGSRGFKGRAEQYARRFGVSLEWLLTGRGAMERRPVLSDLRSEDVAASFERHHDVEETHKVKVAGRIGAGAEIFPDAEQVPPEGLFEIEIPFPVPESALAFEIEGDSMWPRYDAGDVVLCWREGTNPAEIIGWEAAVRTHDGKRYLKRILQGSRARHYDLESYNAPVIRNVKLEWVAKVQLVVRAGEWKQLGRAVQRRIAKKIAITK